MSQEALRRIAENKRSKEKFLDLSRSELQGPLPEEIAELTWLEFLYLHETQVTDLQALNGLTQLKRLDLDNTPVTDIQPLTGLTQLNTLFLHNTQVADIQSLMRLRRLQRLLLHGTQVVDIQALTGLTQLKSLSLGGTQVADLQPLKRLIEQGIKVQLSGHHTKNGIFVESCPLTNPPIEIVRQGSKAILNYWKEREAQGEDHLYEAKVLLIGEGGAGKTSLLRRLYQPNLPLPEKSETTKGIDIHLHEFPLPNGRNMRLNVWDFGGQEIYHATHQFFLTKRSLYILLDNTRKDHRSVQDEGFKYWLEVIDLLSDHSPVLIFQNQVGGRSKDIDLAGIKGAFDNVKECYAGNLDEPASADHIRDAIQLYASQLPHIGEALPAKWVVIRGAIEQVARQKAYISQDEYYSIYQAHLPFDETKALHLSDYFHDLGIFLHFQRDRLLDHLVILQNTWATEAVFKVLDDEKVKAQWGRFDFPTAKAIWKDSTYAGKYNELLELMLKFELCYELKDVQPQTWLAPGLLRVSKPDALVGWPQLGDLVLRYEYEFMPKGLVNRLTVRMHRYVRQPALAWRNGVFFEHEGAELLVEVSSKGNEMVLRARGQMKKELLVVIAAELDALNAGYKGLEEKVKKWVPCNCKECLKRTMPEAYEYRRLIERKQDGKNTIECPKRPYLEVSVLELLDGITGLVRKADASDDDTLRNLHLLMQETHAITSENKLLLQQLTASQIAEFAAIKTSLSAQDRQLVEIKGFGGMAALELGQVLAKLERSAITDQQMLALIQEIDTTVISKMDQLPKAIQNVWEALKAQEPKEKNNVKGRFKFRIAIIPEILYWETDVDAFDRKSLIKFWRENVRGLVF